jgi:hypothetical protein
MNQQETLTLAAQVVDQFSAPLRDLTKQLRAFSGLQQDTNVRGKRDVDRHWQSYRDLNKQVTDTAASTKKLLQPAIEALGVSSLSTLGSIAGVTAAVRAFGQSSETLGYLRTETGLTVQALRTLEAAGERVGISAGQTDSSLQKFAENLAQYKKGKGPFIEAMKGQSADMMAFFKSLADMPIGDAIAAIRRKMGSVKGQDRRLFARLIGMPEDFGRETDEIVARTEKFLGKLTDAQRASGEKMQQNWHDLRDAIRGASDTTSADLAPALGAAYENLAKFVSEAPEVAAIAASLASIPALWGARAAVRGFLGLGGGAAAGAAGGAGLLGPGLLGLGAFGLGAGALKLTSPNKLNRPEDLYKPGEGGLSSYRKAVQGMRYGPQLPGAGGFHPISGSFADIAQAFRGEESIYKNVLRGTREGVIEAFQWLKRDREGYAGGGVISAAYHPSEGLGGGLAGAGGGLGGMGGGSSPTDDGSPPMGRAHAHEHAGQRAILGGHVREAAKAIREKISGGSGAGSAPAGGRVTNDYKGSYHMPGGPRDKRAGLGARYALAMSVAEAELARQGISKEHLRAAAAIMVGNASAESELIPSTVHDRNTGYGIYGARLDRRTNMLTWLKNNGYARDSLIGQVRYMAIESAKRGGAAWAALKNATAENLMAGGRTYEHYFEGPARDNNRNAQIGAAYRAHGEAVRAAADGALRAVPALRNNMSTAEINAWNAAHQGTHGAAEGHRSLNAHLHRPHNRHVAEAVRLMQAFNIPDLRSGGKGESSTPNTDEYNPGGGVEGATGIGRNFIPNTRGGLDPHVRKYMGRRRSSNMRATRRSPSISEGCHAA